MRIEVYRDLTPDFEDIPDECWAGADPKSVVEQLVEDARLTDHPNLANMSLLSILGQAKIQPISEITRQRLKALSPETLLDLEILTARQMARDL